MYNMQTIIIKYNIQTIFIQRKDNHHHTTQQIANHHTSQCKDNHQKLNMGPITIQHKIQTIILQHKDNYNTTQHTDMQPSYNTSYNNKIIKTIFIWHATQHTDNNSHTTLHTDNSHTTEHNDNHQSAYNTAHKKTIIIQHIWLRQSSDIIQVYIHRTYRCDYRRTNYFCWPCRHSSCLYYLDYCCCSVIHHSVTEDQHVCHYMHYFLKSNGTDTLSMSLMEVYDGRIIFTIATAGYLHASSTFVSVSEFDIIRMLTTKTCATSGRKEIENGYECMGLVFDRKRPRGFYGTH